jgi:hypothetical protein
MPNGMPKGTRGALRGWGQVLGVCSAQLLISPPDTSGACSGYTSHLEPDQTHRLLAACLPYLEPNRAVHSIRS